MGNGSITRSQVWIIIPAHNEAQYLGRFLTKLHQVSTRTVVVDDGSSDDSWRIANNLNRHNLRHCVNLGKGTALKTGAEYAFGQLGAKAVVFMDSDDQHDPADLDKFFYQLKQGYQVVLGVRDLNNTMPAGRRWGNTIISLAVRGLFGVYLPDILCGYKAVTRAAYQRLKWRACHYDVELELAVRLATSDLSYTTVNVNTIYHDLDRGMTSLDAMRVLFNLLGWRLVV